MRHRRDFRHMDREGKAASRGQWGWGTHGNAGTMHGRVAHLEPTYVLLTDVTPVCLTVQKEEKGKSKRGGRRVCENSHHDGHLYEGTRACASHRGALSPPGH